MDGLFAPPGKDFPTELTPPEGSIIAEGKQWELLNQIASPRVIKSHMHSHILPHSIWEQKCKVSKMHKFQIHADQIHV